MEYSIKRLTQVEKELVKEHNRVQSHLTFKLIGDQAGLHLALKDIQDKLHDVRESKGALIKLKQTK